MDLDDNSKTEESKSEGKTRKKSRSHYYNPLLCQTNVTGKTYYYQYFKTYLHVYRMLQNDEKGGPKDCHCPRSQIHHFKCPWYNPDITYITDTKNDLSTSEQAAPQKIYNMYQKNTNNPPENCACGTAAAIAYMGHDTGCVEFQHIHERKSYEVLLAILKKIKKVTFADDTDIETQTGFNSGKWRKSWYQRCSNWSTESSKSKRNPTQYVTSTNRFPLSVTWCSFS